MNAIYIVAASLLAPAVYYDLVERRIPNTLILIFIFIAPVSIIYLSSLQDISAHLLSGCIAFAIGLVFWGLGWLGAGDVKLVSILSMLLGLSLLPALLINTALCGLALAIIFLVYKGLLIKALTRYKQTLVFTVTQRKLNYVQPDAQEQQVRLPYAVAIASGAALTLMGVTPF